MIDLNRATILGRLTRDPELRTTPSGQSVTTIGIATNRSWTDSSGTKQERVEYHNVVMWGKLAEIASQYLSKGRRVYVEGRLQTRDWTGQDGVKRYRTEIIAENMIMLDGGGQRNAPNGDGGQIPTIEYGGDTGPSKTKDEIKVEDIPF